GCIALFGVLVGSSVFAATAFLRPIFEILKYQARSWISLSITIMLFSYAVGSLWNESVWENRFWLFFTLTLIPPIRLLLAKKFPISDFYGFSLAMATLPCLVCSFFAATLLLQGLPGAMFSDAITSWAKVK